MCKFFSTEHLIRGFFVVVLAMVVGASVLLSREKSYRFCQNSQLAFLIDPEESFGAKENFYLWLSPLKNREFVCVSIPRFPFLGRLGIQESEIVEKVSNLIFPKQEFFYVKNLRTGDFILENIYQVIGPNEVASAKLTKETSAEAEKDSIFLSSRSGSSIRAQIRARKSYSRMELLGPLPASESDWDALVRFSPKGVKLSFPDFSGGSRNYSCRFGHAKCKRRGKSQSSPSDFEFAEQKKRGGSCDEQRASLFQSPDLDEYSLCARFFSNRALATCGTDLVSDFDREPWFFLAVKPNYWTKSGLGRLKECVETRPSWKEALVKIQYRRNLRKARFMYGA